MTPHHGNTLMSVSSRLLTKSVSGVLALLSGIVRREALASHGVAALPAETVRLGSEVNDKYRKLPVR